MADADGVRAELETLKGDIYRLRADMAGLLKAVRSESNRRVEQTRQKMREEAVHRVDQLKDVVGNCKDYGQKVADQAKKKVEQRPVASLLVAFGVGLVIGRLFMGGRR